MNHRMLPRMLAACAALATMLGTAIPAMAQIPWNPPCSRIKYVNRTNCTFNFMLATNPAGALPTVFLTPGATVSQPVPGPMQLVAVISALGNPYGWTAVPSPPAPGPWKVTAVTMGPPDCCVDVYADTATCTVTIVPSAGPFPCND